MYPLAIIAILLGLLATFSFVEPQTSLRNHSERALAVNFCIYRTAVSDYVRTHPDIASVPANAIELPTGYRSIRNWQARISGGYCYVYGEASQDEVFAIRELMGNSVLIGRNVNSRLKALPVDWNYTIPFGLFHTPGAAVTVKRFLSAARAVFSL